MPLKTCTVCGVSESEDKYSLCGEWVSRVYTICMVMIVWSRWDCTVCCKYILCMGWYIKVYYELFDVIFNDNNSTGLNQNTIQMLLISLHPTSYCWSCLCLLVDNYEHNAVHSAGSWWYPPNSLYLFLWDLWVYLCFKVVLNYDICN